MSAWVELVAVAIQGTGRRPPDRAAWLADLGEPAATVGGEPAEAVLDAAALATVARRAGALSQSAHPAADPVAVDHRPSVSPEALGLATMYPDTVTQLVNRAAELGLRLPANWVPWLLDLPASTAEPEVVRTLAGPLGRWLAARNPAWAGRYAVESALNQPGQGVDEVDQPSAPTDDTPWREGSTAVRIAWLHRLRARDPEASQAYVREALAPRGEPAAMKEQIIRVLRAAPLPSDEDLLDACLDARASGVREQAQAALASRPESAFARRMAQRCWEWIRVTGSLEFEIEVPTVLDADAVRDGLDRHQNAGRRANQVRDVVSSVPLADWAQFGTPMRLLAASVASPFAAALREAWVARALAEHDAEWAEALIRHRGDTLGHSVEPLARLLTVPARDRLSRELAPQLVATGGRNSLASLWFRLVPFPLDDEICASVIASLPAWGQGQNGFAASAFVARVGLEQPPRFVRELTEIAYLVPPHVARAVHDAVSRQTVRARIEQLLLADHERSLSDPSDILTNARPDRPDHVPPSAHPQGES